MRRPLAQFLALTPCLLVLACSDAVPIPKEFDAAFTAGRVCVPSQIATGGANQTYPVRFEFCRYRCINLDKYEATIRSAWQCAAGQCSMMLLAATHATRIDSEEDCDGRDLADPPADECTKETYDFVVTLPSANGQPSTGNFLTTIPYLELEQADKIIGRIQAGEDAGTVLKEDAGSQNYPSRQFMLSFETSYAPVTSHDLIAPSDCHQIPLP
jgi:hypothetical protein